MTTWMIVAAFVSGCIVGGGLGWLFNIKALAWGIERGKIKVIEP